MSVPIVAIDTANPVAASVLNKRRGRPSRARRREVELSFIVLLICWLCWAWSEGSSGLDRSRRSVDFGHNKGHKHLRVLGPAGRPTPGAVGAGTIPRLSMPRSRRTGLPQTSDS